jgi:hypothetical protein
LNLSGHKCLRRMHCFDGWLLCHIEQFHFKCEDLYDTFQRQVFAWVFASPMMPNLCRDCFRSHNQEPTICNSFTKSMWVKCCDKEFS